MLRIVQNRNAAGAKSYFSKADYYGHESVGRWGGRAAALLELTGDVQQKDFAALCDNLDPRTGKRLTPRTDADRTVAYDFNFNVPKGISLVYALNEDKRIIDAMRASVDETMRELEADAKTRVRGRGRDSERGTGSLAWAEFVHHTSRPIDGVPDPNSHIHAVVLNATFDEREQRFKAAQFRDIKRDAPYYEAAFEARFAKRLNELGYRTERKGKSWDLVGLPKELTAKFSRRTQLIEELARAKGIQNPEEKSTLGAKTREKKQEEQSMPELRKLWRERLTPAEAELLDGMRGNKDGETSFVPDRSGESLEYAIGHCLERNSVVPTRTLMAQALKHGVGSASVDSVKSALEHGQVIRGQYRGRDMATTREVLNEETCMLRFAREGRKQEVPLNPDWRIQRDWLSAGQRAAVEHVLQSHDRVVAIRGRAGTGKTTLMKETVEGIEAGGHKVFTFAPSANASRGVLRSEGFENATTVAELLVNEKLQRESAGEVLWIDEAGQLGTRTLKQVFDIAERNDCRVVLSGDWKQHGSVERGAAMRLLEHEAGIKPAVVSENQRQEPMNYRAVVDMVAEGKVEAAIKRMDQLGWIREVGEADRNLLIAHDYADCIEQNASVLTICPTHLEGDKVSAAIRQELKARKLLDREDHSVMRLVPLHLSETERRDPAAYELGDVLVYHQNAKGHKKGDRVKLTEPLAADLAEQAKQFQVYRESRLSVAKGEKISITAGGTTKDGKHRLMNGARYSVADVLPSGDLRLDNGWVVSKDFGFLRHAYVSTSHASQGMTVNHVLIAEPSNSLAAASVEQLNVSLSRGRQSARIFTDSKDAMLAAVHKSSDRVGASELFSEGKQFDTQHRQLQLARAKILAAREVNQPTRDWEYLYDGR